ncbi:hypothetical protein [Edaphobacter sp. HDX4]|uniref:hypothetical protein n=1 Tax=Edaphobacter sp. HDX4 TaxID=2794064 RepID=UPI002FE65A14
MEGNGEDARAKQKRCKRNKSSFDGMRSHSAQDTSRDEAEAAEWTGELRAAFIGIKAFGPPLEMRGGWICAARTPSACDEDWKYAVFAR